MSDDMFGIKKICNLVQFVCPQNKRHMLRNLPCALIATAFRQRHVD